MTGNTWKAVGLAAGVLVPAILYIGATAVLHWRVQVLEDDKRDLNALKAADARLAGDLKEEVARLDGRIDAQSERISTQWGVVADAKERLIRLEAAGGR